MTRTELADTARALVVDGKGLLAADETAAALTQRFDTLRIPSTPQSRGTYRELLFTTTGVSAFISGVVVSDETVRHRTAKGVPLLDLLGQQGILSGISVDRGAAPLAGAPGEYVTEGLDGLRERLIEYYGLGVRFAKWGALVVAGDGPPSRRCIEANAHALARFAALCQHQSLVPIVEADVLIDPSGTLDRCEEVTGDVLQAVFDALYDQRVILEGMLLQTSMVISGPKALRPSGIDELAAATVRCLRRHVPAAVPGVLFLSGTQDALQATAHLSLINRVAWPMPWKITFAYARALQDEALHAWRGKPENVSAAQRAFHHRAKCASAAALGGYSASLERESAVA